MRRWWCALLGTCCATALAAAPETPRVTVPLMQAVPLIDGVIGESEWAGAARMIGLVNPADLALGDREVIFWVGCDGKRLLLAMKSEMPPGDNILYRAVPDDTRDVPLAFFDDNIELWIDPHYGKTRGDRRFFHIIANARGALFDCAYDTPRDADHVDVAWRVNWQFASRFIDGWWNVEIAIPLENLGAVNDLDHPWGLRVGRNWQRPGEQSRWESANAVHDDVPTMPVVAWKEDAPVVQLLSLREDGRASLRLRVSNPGDTAVDAKVFLSDAWSSNPPKEFAQTLAVPARSRQDIIFNPPDGGSNGLHRTIIRVTAPDSNQAFYAREFKWRLRRPAEPWSTGRQEAQVVDLQFKVYPSFNKLKVKADISALVARDRVTGGVLRVLRSGEAKPIAEQRLNFSHHVAGQLFDAPLTEGDYTLALSLEGGDGVPKEPATQNFERRTFPWEKNQLGISEHVIPPFTPLKVSGQTISCVLREHTAGAAGLWDQIMSEGQPLLAAPMRWEIVAGGKSETATGGGWKTERTNETEVVSAASWRAGAVRAKVRAETDYDGMTKFTLTLPPSPGASVEKLTLVIPVKDSEAAYLHACGDQLRYNYAGKVPPGNGVVWDSSKGNKTDITGTFYPYVWVGGGARGVCWFADNDRDWSLDEKTPTVELARDGGTLALRVHFITRPTALDRERQIVFGVQATPVKPMPADWRKWQCSKHPPGSRPFNIIGSTYYYGCLSYDFYPAGHDLAIFQKLSEARDTGKADMSYVDAWLKQHLPDEKPDSEHYVTMQRHIAAGLRSAAGTPRADGWRWVPYTNIRGMGFHMDEWPTFQDEWHNFAYYNRATKGQLDYDITPTKSFQDAALWYYREMAEVFDGIYWDNTFLAANYDTVAGGAWVDEQGRTHPGLGLWAMRELIKRTAVMFHEMKRDGIFVSHMTNASIIPVNAFANCNLDWEWKYGWDDFQDRFTPELTVAESIGRQTGSFPLTLAGGVLDHKDARYPWAMRTRLGVQLVHEMRAWDFGPEAEREFYKKLYEFGYGNPDCRVFNYWDAGHPVKVEALNARTIALARAGRAIVIVTDYGNGGASGLSLDTKALGLRPDAAAKDFETGQSVESPAPGVFVFKLKKHDFKALLFE